jgi:hypothetical protein
MRLPFQYVTECEFIFEKLFRIWIRGQVDTLDENKPRRQKSHTSVPWTFTVQIPPTKSLCDKSKKHRTGHRVKAWNCDILHWKGFARCGHPSHVIWPRSDRQIRPRGPESKSSKAEGLWSPTVRCKKVETVPPYPLEWIVLKPEKCYSWSKGIDFLIIK